MSRIAVVVPHFRQAQFLAECIDSLLAQTRVPDEIVVVDSSPEDTAAIMARYGAAVRHVVAPIAGVAAARNTGIAATTSELVAFLDADNIAMPERLQMQVRAFERNPKTVLCHGAMALIDRDGAAYSGASIFRSEQVLETRQLGWLLERNRIATDSVCTTRAMLRTFGGFCETRGVREDYDLWLRLASAGPFRYLDVPLARYRRHETNLSNDERYMFEWEGGALRRIDWATTERALGAAFADPDARLLAAGEIRLRRGEHAEATRCFEMLQNGPLAGAALFHLAHLAIERGALSEGFEALRQALDLDPHDAASWNNLGVVHAMSGDHERAQTNFTRAVAARAEYRDAEHNLRRARTGRGADWRVTRRRLRPALMPLSATAARHTTDSAETLS
jgi:GT2 family glycosyltransferase